jgi:hypothetical protein
MDGFLEDQPACAGRSDRYAPPDQVNLADAVQGQFERGNVLGKLI